MTSVSKTGLATLAWLVIFPLLIVGGVVWGRSQRDRAVVAAVEQALGAEANGRVRIRGDRRWGETVDERRHGRMRLVCGTVGGDEDRAFAIVTYRPRRKAVRIEALAITPPAGREPLLSETRLLSVCA